jgi:hypothetical protein
MATLRLAPSLVAAAALSLAPLTPATAALAPTAQEREAPESAIKAAYLLHFASYVEWSRTHLPRSDSAIRIGVMEDGPLGLELAEAARGKSVTGHPIEVVQLGAEDELLDLHVLFVGRAVDHRLPGILAAGRGKGILLVTEADEALAQGSVVNFILADDRLRFDISLDSAREAGLRLSSRLLAVARVVVGKP